MNETRLVPIGDLTEYEEHIFRPYTDKRLKELTESIRESGILNPLIVRPKDGDKYEILSGHNRWNAAKAAGLNEVPVRVFEGLNDDEARLVVTETNLIQRSMKDLLYSERAKALIQHYAAAKKQGKRSDLIAELDKICSTTSRPGGKKLKGVGESATKKAGDIFGISARDVSRYFRLKDLAVPLLDMLDEGLISIHAAADIAGIDKDGQELIRLYMKAHDCKIGNEKGAKLRKEAKTIDGGLTEESVARIMSSERAKRDSDYRLNADIYEEYLSDISPEEVDDVIRQALETWKESRG